MIITLERIEQGGEGGKGRKGKKEERDLGREKELNALRKPGEAAGHQQDRIPGSDTHETHQEAISPRASEGLR